MSDGFAQIYLDKRYADYSFSFLHGYFYCSGLSIENPFSGIIWRLTEDGRIAMPLELVINHIATEREITFQWWFSDSEDLYCRFRFLEQTVCIEFYLDGLEEEQKDIVCNACIALLRLLISLNVGIGLVVDRRGYSVELDWDSIFLRQHQFPVNMPLPDILAFSKSSNCFDNIRDDYEFIEEYQGFCFIANPD